MNRWTGLRMAEMPDPLEYDGNRRRPFWDVTAGRAARGDASARADLMGRALFLDKAAKP